MNLCLRFFKVSGFQSMTSDLWETLRYFQGVLEVNQNKKTRRLVFWEAVNLKLGPEAEDWCHYTQQVSEKPMGDNLIEPGLGEICGELGAELFDLPPEAGRKKCLQSNLKKVMILKWK